MNKFKITSVLLIPFLAIYLCFSCTNVKSDERDSAFMLKDDVKVVSPGKRDAVVEWGGRQIKVSELHDKWGQGATRRLWNKLDSFQRGELLKCYTGWMRTPIELEKHFGKDVRGKMVEYYLDNTLLRKLQKDAARYRIDQKIPASYQEALGAQLIAPPTSYGDIDLQEFPEYKEAKKLYDSLRERQKAISKLYHMATRCEVTRIGAMCYAVTAFAMSEIVGLITGGFYQTTQIASEVIGTVINRAYSVVESKLNSGLTPEQIVELYGQLQHIYLTSITVNSEKILARKDELKKLREKIYEKAIKIDQEQWRERKAQMQQEVNKVDAKVAVSTPAVHVKIEKGDSAEKIRKKKIAALEAKIRELSKIKNRIINQYSKQYRSLMDAIYEKKHQEFLAPYVLASRDVSHTRWWYVRFYITELIRLKEQTILHLKSLKNSNLEAISHASDYETYLGGASSRMRSLRDSYASELGPILGKITGAKREIARLTRDVFRVSGLKVSDTWLASQIIKTIPRIESVIEGLVNLREAAREENQNIEKAISARRGRIKEVQSQYQTIANNYLYAYDQLAKAVRGQKKIIGESESQRWWWAYRGEEMIEEIKQAFLEGDMGEIERLASQYGKVMNELTSLYEKGITSYNYACRRSEEMRSFIFSNWDLAMEINYDMAECDEISPPKLLESYAYRQKQGRGKSEHQLKQELTLIHSGAPFELELVLRKVISFNSEAKRKMEINLSRINSIAASIDLDRVARLSRDEYGAWQRSMHRRLSEQGAHFVYTQQVELCKEFPRLSKWAPPLGRGIYAWTEQGQRIIICQIVSQENRELIKKVGQAINNFWERGRGKSVEEKREELAKIFADIETIEINNQPFSSYQKYDTVEFTSQDLRGQRLRLSGTAFCGFPVEYVQISYAGMEEQARIIRTYFDGRKSISEWEYDLDLTEELRQRPFEVSFMAFEGRWGNGPRYKFKYIDTAMLKDANRQIRELVSKMQDDYRMKNLRRMTSYISEECYNIMDIEDEIEQGFEEMDFLENLRIDISNLLQTKQEVMTNINWEKVILDSQGKRFDKKGQGSLGFKWEGDSFKIVKANNMFWQPIRVISSGGAGGAGVIKEEEIIGTVTLRSEIRRTVEGFESPDSFAECFDFGSRSKSRASWMGGRSGDIYNHGCYLNSNGEGFIDLGSRSLEEIDKVPASGYRPAYEIGSIGMGGDHYIGQVLAVKTSSGYAVIEVTDYEERNDGDITSFTLNYKIVNAE